MNECKVQCSKFFQSANAFVKAAKPSAMFKVPLDPKGRFHSEAEKEC